MVLAESEKVRGVEITADPAFALAPAFIAGNDIIARMSDRFLQALVQAAEKFPPMADLLTTVTQQPMDPLHKAGILIGSALIGAAVGAIPGYLIDRHQKLIGAVLPTTVIGVAVGLAIGSTFVANR